MGTLLSVLVLLGPLVELLAKATLLLACAALLARALRRAPASARHLAWGLGAVMVVALPLVVAVTPSWKLSLPIPAASKARPALGDDAGLALASGKGRPETALAPVLQPAAARGAAAVATKTAPNAQDAAALISVIVLVAWAAGSLLALARLARAAVAAHGILRRGRRVDADDAALDIAAALGIARPVALVESDEIRVPMTLGARRPAVLVPDGFSTWDPARRHAVLLHEMAHVRRNDWLLQCLAQVASSMLWFHPLARLAERRLREEAEQAADDLVLAQGTKASAYAAHLLGLVRDLHRLPGNTAMAVSMIGGPFDGRIRAILDAARSRGPAPARLRAALLAASVAVFGACAAVDVTASPVHESPMQHARKVMRHVLGQGTPDSGREWFARGMEQHDAGEHASAIASFQKAIDAGHATAIASYNIACGHALLGHDDAAMDWLERSVEAGFEVDAYLRTDADLASLRKLPRFQAFLAEHDDADAAARLRSQLAELESSSDADAGDWYEVGMEHFYAGYYSEAAKALARADALKPQASTILYNLACAHGLAGNRSQGLDALERAVEAGWDDPDHVEDDSDLDPLRDDPRFAAILEDVRRLEMPTGFQVFGHSLGASREDWRAAKGRHEEYLKRHPGAGGAWFNLGLASLRSDDYRRAVEAFQRSHALGFRVPASAYNVACGHARAGETDLAFEWLEQARKDGFESWGMMHGDDDVESLKGDPRFDDYAGAGWHERMHGHVRRIWSF